MYLKNFLKIKTTIYKTYLTNNTKLSKQQKNKNLTIFVQLKQCKNILIIKH